MDLESNIPPNQSETNVSFPLLPPVGERVSDKAKKGKRNRTAGHKAEINYANILKLLHPSIVTSRYASMHRDKVQKLDLTTIEVNDKMLVDFQIKNTSKIVDYHSVLESMQTPAAVVLHYYTKRVNQKFVPQGEYAILHTKTFVNLLANATIYKRIYEKIIEKSVYIDEVTKAEIQNELNTLLKYEEITKKEGILKPLKVRKIKNDDDIIPREN